MDKLRKELMSFSNLWRGGTTHPRIGWEKSVETSIHQDLEQIVEICISPYVNQTTNVLEIGAGGGFWTQRMLNANSITCFDALSAKHNRFWRRIGGKRKNVSYFKVSDFKCNELKKESIDYVFSYDVFCHISYSGASAYLRYMRRKLADGANCLIMIADADKYDFEDGRNKLMRRAGFSNFNDLVRDYDGAPKNGRWYFYGTDLFCKLLERHGYTLVSRDVATEADKLNPIIHFRK